MCGQDPKADADWLASYHTPRHRALPHACAHHVCTHRAAVNRTSSASALVRRPTTQRMGRFGALAVRRPRASCALTHAPGLLRGRRA